MISLNYSMSEINPLITFRALGQNDQVPYELLLLADPSRKLVDEYLNHSEVYLATIHDDILGVIVLTPLSTVTMEIKNVAVRPDSQGQGIGSFLISQAIQICADRKIKSICIGTADSSRRQLALYQRLGFKVSVIWNEFFIENYPEPIFEDGVQAKDMVMLVREI